MKRKEEWIDEVLNSFDGFQRSMIPQDLQERITQTLPGRSRPVMLRRPTMWLMAAGLALLAGLNLYSIHTRELRPYDRVASYANPVAAEYFTPPPSI